jgi:uncharacterized protein
MDPERRAQLLRLARDTIGARLAGSPLPPLPEIETEAAGFGGAFVTLHKAGRLRGCIGRFNPDTNLAETIQQMALAAMDDPRFRDLPIAQGELPQIDIEVSILSPMRRTDNPLSLELGVHGIYVRQGIRSGCFLPQVATEQHWSREEFLSRCCAGKAGLPPDAWKDPRTEVHLFSAEVFGEKERDPS